MIWLKKAAINGGEEVTASQLGTQAIRTMTGMRTALSCWDIRECGLICNAAPDKQALFVKRVLLECIRVLEQVQCVKFVPVDQSHLQLARLRVHRAPSDHGALTIELVV